MPLAKLRPRRRPGPERCRRKFLRVFPEGFHDETYLAWERDYKWTAHEAWRRDLHRVAHRALLREGRYAEVAARAVRIESRTNLLFSFEKMALRDGVRTPRGARTFAEGLYELLHGRGDLEKRFDTWCQALDALPRRQTRVLTWPVATVFGFLAQPETHFFFKPLVTRAAAREWGTELPYASRPSSSIYGAVLALASDVARTLADLGPRDQIDVQSFLWVQGSSEYED
jgi:hypothetical protein